MDNRNVIYFLTFLLVLVIYFLYERSIDNNRLYKICQDQQITIELQSEAVKKQNLYIYMINSSKNQKLEYSPVH
jgi:hypothetical protein